MLLFTNVLQCLQKQMIVLKRLLVVVASLLKLSSRCIHDYKPPKSAKKLAIGLCNSKSAQIAKAHHCWLSTGMILGCLFIAESSIASLDLETWQM
jgi:hypothetical protein